MLLIFLSLNTSLNWWLTTAFQSDFLFSAGVIFHSHFSVQWNGMVERRALPNSTRKTCNMCQRTCKNMQSKNMRIPSFSTHLVVSLCVCDFFRQVYRRQTGTSSCHRNDRGARWSWRKLSSRFQWNQQWCAPLWFGLSSGYLSMLKWQDKGLVGSLTVLWSLSHIGKC